MSCNSTISRILLVLNFFLLAGGTISGAILVLISNISDGGGIGCGDQDTDNSSRAVHWSKVAFIFIQGILGVSCCWSCYTSTFKRNKSLALFYNGISALVLIIFGTSLIIASLLINQELYNCRQQKIRECPSCYISSSKTTYFIYSEIVGMIAGLVFTSIWILFYKSNDTGLVFVPTVES